MSLSTDLIQTFDISSALWQRDVLLSYILGTGLPLCVVLEPDSLPLVSLDTHQYGKGQWPTSVCSATHYCTGLYCIVSIVPELITFASVPRLLILLGFKKKIFKLYYPGLSDFTLGCAVMHIFLELINVVLYQVFYELFNTHRSCWWVKFKMHHRLLSISMKILPSEMTEMKGWVFFSLKKKDTKTKKQQQKTSWYPSETRTKVPLLRYGASTISCNECICYWWCMWEEKYRF